MYVASGSKVLLIYVVGGNGSGVLVLVSKPTAFMVMKECLVAFVKI